MADKDARGDAAAPPPPADGFGGRTDGIAAWIKRARTFNRKQEAWTSGENSTDASHAEDEPLQPASRSISPFGSASSGA